MKQITSWLVLGMFLYSVTIVLKRKSTLFTLHMAYMADIISWKKERHAVADAVLVGGTS